MTTIFSDAGMGVAIYALAIIGMSLSGCGDNQEPRGNSTATPAVAATRQDPPAQFITILNTTRECKGMNGRSEIDYITNYEIRGTHIVDILQAVLESPCEQNMQRPVARYNGNYPSIDMTLFDGKCEFSKEPRLASMSYVMPKSTGSTGGTGCWTLSGSGMDAVIAYRVGEYQGTAAAYSADIIELKR